MVALGNIKKIFRDHTLSFEEYYTQAQQKCDTLHTIIENIDPNDHIYTMEEATKELGLDETLIDTLLEDYVKQIISTVPQMRSYLHKIKHPHNLDGSPLRDLAHKNLGVARNLRIKDAQKILQCIMKSTDIKKIQQCIEYLEACAILLKPHIAYEAYKK